MVMKGKTSRPKELLLANGSLYFGIKRGGTATVLALGKGKGRTSIESNEVSPRNILWGDKSGSSNRKMVLSRGDKVTVLDQSPSKSSIVSPIREIEHIWTSARGIR